MRIVNKMVVLFLENQACDFAQRKSSDCAAERKLTLRLAGTLSISLNVPVCGSTT